MEKTNKYYGIIENLVRNHKKFQGLEAILDDIIDDVYAHSEVIINSISNDSVIQAYLEKVVSTSIITVPKKMGFHSEIKHRVVTPELPKQPEAPQVQPAKEVKKVVNNDLVDKMINSMPATVAVEEQPIELTEAVEETEFENIEPINETFDVEKSVADSLEQDLNIEPETDNVLEEVIEPAVQDDLEVQDTPVTENLTFETNDFVDDELQLEDLNDVQEEPVLEVAEDIVEEKEDAPIVEELAGTDNLTEEQETPDTLDVLQDEEPLMETTELEEFAPIDTEDDLLELSEEQLDVSNEPVEEVASENLEVEDFTELTEDLSTSELAEDDLLEPQESLELNELSEEQPLGILDENLDDIADSITTTLEANLEENNEPTGKFKPMDYSVFDFTPQENNEEVDVDEIKANIEELDSKHPELNILKVYDLKYKNKNSVSEIATQLSMNEEQVVEALNEIIAVV